MAQNNASCQPSASAGSQSWVENTVCDPWLVEFVDVENVDPEADCSNNPHPIGLM